MRVAHFLSFLGMIFLGAGCCNEKDPVIVPDDQDAVRFLYYDDGTFWEVSDSARNRRRFAVLGFSRNLVELTKVYNYLWACGPPSDKGYHIQYGAKHAGADSLLINLRFFSLRSLADPEVYYLDRQWIGQFRRFYLNVPVDTLGTAVVKGDTIYNVRRYDLSISKYLRGDTTYKRYADSVSVYLAPNIGPVLVRLSNGQEWKLVDYSIVKPRLN